MNYVIFDDKLIENFYPVTLNRSTGDLRLGILKLRQRIAGYLETDKYSLIIPANLTDMYRERDQKREINNLHASDTIFINSRLKISDDWIKKIKSMPVDTCYSSGDVILVARLKAEEQNASTENLGSLFSGLKRIDSKEEDCWKYIWELVAYNQEYIKRDFENFFYDQDNFFETEPGVTILNPYNVWIGEGTELKPGVVIDASEGPVVLDENVRILSNSVITGPVYVGKNSLIKAGAKIYEGTSIGPVCKIGGEVENTIFQGYSNKQHDGFLGHSYLGEWINLGADTNNSDLKNNYKTVKSYFYPSGQKIDTGSQFFGAVMGDHVKTGINCAINTGAVIGMGCNLYGHDLISDFIPSFSWGTSSCLTPYRLESFLETAEIVKARRSITITDHEKNLLKSLYDRKD